MQLEDIQASLVGTTVIGTGDGGGVSRSKTMVETGPNQPNLLVTVVTPVLALLVRFAHQFGTILVGLVAGGMTTDVIPYNDFLDLVMKCAGLSVAGAGLALIKDVVTIFGRLEQKYPLITGNV